MPKSQAPYSNQPSEASSQATIWLPKRGLTIPLNLDWFIKWWEWVSFLLMWGIANLVLNLAFSILYKNFIAFSSLSLWLQTAIQTGAAIYGTRKISESLDQHLPWTGHLKKRLFAQSVYNLGFVTLSMVSLQVVFRLVEFWWEDGIYITLRDEILITATFIAISFVTSLLDLALFLLGQWRVSEGRVERFRKESVEFQFEMLRNQVNPHFLFNNLNTIASLVHEQPAVAGEFVKQLSRVYRYLLEYQNRDLITLEEELDFIKSYIFLVELRFNKNLFIELEIPPTSRKLLIIPVCLQMLVENAIKHNVVSRAKPLYLSIKVSDDGQWLKVANNIQIKPQRDFSSGIGLSNIISRYNFFTERPVSVEELDGQFVVQIPLLARHERTNN